MQCQRLHADVEKIMHPILKKLQESCELDQALPPSIHVGTFYEYDRLVRRGVENAAIMKRVKKEVIALVHR